MSRPVEACPRLGPCLPVSRCRGVVSRCRGWHVRRPSISHAQSRSRRSLTYPPHPSQVLLTSPSLSGSPSTASYSTWASSTSFRSSTRPVVTQDSPGCQTSGPPTVVMSETCREGDFRKPTRNHDSHSDLFGLGSLSALSRSWGRSRSRESPLLDMLVPVRPSPVPSVVRGSFVVKFLTCMTENMSREGGRSRFTDHGSRFWRELRGLEARRTAKVSLMHHVPCVCSLHRRQAQKRILTSQRTIACGREAEASSAHR